MTSWLSPRSPEAADLLHPRTVGRDRISRAMRPGRMLFAVERLFSRVTKVRGISRLLWRWIFRGKSSLAFPGWDDSAFRNPVAVIIVLSCKAHRVFASFDTLGYYIGNINCDYARNPFVLAWNVTVKEWNPLEQMNSAERRSRDSLLETPKL